MHSSTTLAKPYQHRPVLALLSSLILATACDSSPTVDDDAGSGVTDAEGVDRVVADVGGPDAGGGTDAGLPDRDHTGDARAQPDGSVCLNDRCAGNLANGMSCRHADQCASGNCVENICCDGACDEVCSSCLAALTGMVDGVCDPIRAGEQDLAPAQLCSANGLGCGAAGCACAGIGSGESACRYGLGAACTDDTFCASGVCECADEQCAARRCAAVRCPTCAFSADGLACVQGLGRSAPYSTEGCGGDQACHDGHCLGRIGTSCLGGDECGSGLCSCGDPTCSTGGMICAAGPCPECAFTEDGLTCSGELANSVACDDGDACTRDDRCRAGGCIGGTPVVCNRPRPCEQPEGVCDPDDGSCLYALKQVGELCRPAAGFCDAAEYCDGHSDSCPADVKRVLECRPAAGNCDLAEACDGVADDCPADVKSTAECRPAAGVCDLAEFCDGVVDNCPFDAKHTEECRPAAGVCDLAERCNGATNDCPTDGKSTAECRPAASNCDLADFCDGTTDDCPVDVLVTADTDCGTCRRCDGAGNCQPNSTDHLDCAACRKCSTGSCVDQGLGEDLRGLGDCAPLDCSQFLWGWSTGTTCHVYQGTTAFNGTCDGDGACANAPTSCTGQGEESARCGHRGCKAECPAGSPRGEHDQVFEICFTDLERHNCPSSMVCNLFGNCESTGSCPFLYVWDGAGFRFETDLHGPGKLATRTAEGYLRSNPHDYYLVDTAPRTLGDGYEMRLVEQRHEVDYLDLVEIYALQVPDDRRVYAEKPSFNTPYQGMDPHLHTTLVTPQVPIGAVHVNTGEDVLATLSTSGSYLILNQDREEGFEYQTIELDLGDLSEAPQIKLVIDGRTLFPATPAGVERAGTFGPRTRLEVQDAQGTWVKVPTELATLPRPPEFRRPFVIDVSDIFPTTSYRVRLTFLFKTYLDTIALDTSEDISLDLTPVPLTSAELRYHGYSETVGDELHEYIYASLRDSTPRPFPGAYTVYGEILPLLAEFDDMFGIYFGGDEIALRFQLDVEPESGHHLRLMVRSIGYYKDAKVDVPRTVAPLPFAAMSNFPYDEAQERYPDDPEHQEYLEQWNTRTYP